MNQLNSLRYFEDNLQIFHDNWSEETNGMSFCEATACSHQHWLATNSIEQYNSIILEKQQQTGTRDIL